MGYELGIVGGKTKIGDVDKAGALSFALGSPNWPEADNKSGKKKRKWGVDSVFYL